VSPCRRGRSGPPSTVIVTSPSRTGPRAAHGRKVWRRADSAELHLHPPRARGPRSAPTVRRGERGPWWALGGLGAAGPRWRGRCWAWGCLLMGVRQLGCLDRTPGCLFPRRVLHDGGMDRGPSRLRTPRLLLVGAFRGAGRRHSTASWPQARPSRGQADPTAFALQAGPGREGGVTTPSELGAAPRDISKAGGPQRRPGGARAPRLTSPARPTPPTPAPVPPQADPPAGSRFLFVKQARGPSLLVNAIVRGCQVCIFGP